MLTLLITFGSLSFVFALVSEFHSWKLRKQQKLIDRVVSANTLSSEEQALATVRDDLARAAMSWTEYRALRGHLYRSFAIKSEPRKARKAA